MDRVVLGGTVDDGPVAVELADGRTLWALCVRVPGHGPIDVVSESGPPEAAIQGAVVVVIGRVRRRFFRAGGRTVGRTEVVADRVVATQRRRAARAAIRRAAAELAEVELPGGP